MFSSHQLKISENLSGSLAYSIISMKAYVNSRPTLIALLELELKYQCSKLLGKCYDDFAILPEIDGEPYTVVLDLDKVESEGKFKISAREQKVNVAIDRGKGEASLKIVYQFLVKPPNTGIFSYTITLFLDTGRERLRIGDPIKFTVNAVKPIDISTIDIEPKSSLFFPGDNISILTKLYSNYKGYALIVIDGAVNKLSEKIELSEGEQELVKRLVLQYRDIGYIEVSIEIPEIEFKVMKKLTLNISPSKIDVEIVDTPSEIFIGEKARIRIRIANKSLVSKCLLKSKAKIYEHYIEKEISLGPGESIVEDLITPVITQKSIEEVNSFVELVDIVSGYSWSQQLTLLKPMMPIIIDVDKKHKIYSSENRYSVNVKVENKLASNLEISLSLSKLSICDVVLQFSKLLLRPFEFSEIFIEIKPKSIGVETLKINIIAKVNGLKIYEHFEEIVLEIIPSFDIVKNIVQDIKSDRAIKGQRFRVYLYFKVFSESDVNIRLLSKNLKFHEDRFIIIPPEFEKPLDVVAIDYGDVVVTVSDGVYSLDIKLPITIVKPEINIIARENVIYGGIKNIIGFEVENPYDIELKLVAEIDEESPFIRFITKNKEIFLKPNAKDLVEFEVMGLKHVEKTSFNLTLKIYPSVEELKEEYVFSKNFYFSVENPIDIQLNIKYSNIYIPIIENSSSIYKELYIPIYITMIVKNITKYFIDNIEVNLRFKELLDKSALYSEKRSLDPGSSAPIEIVATIPYNYGYNLVTLLYKAVISGYYNVEENEIKVPIARYAPIVINFSRNEFKSKLCPYPRIELKDKVLLYIPVGVDLNSIYIVCGEPLKISEHHIELANLLHNILLDHIKRGIRNIWDAISSLIFKYTFYIKSDFSEEQKIYKSIICSVSDIDILPAVLWKATLGRFVSQRVEKYLVNVDRIGLLIPHSETRFQVIRNDFYANLYKFVFYNDSESRLWLYNYIKDNVDMLIVDSMYLLYILNGGDAIKFNEKVFASLLKREDFSSLLIYLALTNLNEWMFNEEIVKKVKEVIDEKRSVILSKNSLKIALSIILRELFKQFQNRVSKVKQVEL